MLRFKNNYNNLFIFNSFYHLIDIIHEFNICHYFNKPKLIKLSLSQYIDNKLSYRIN